MSINEFLHYEFDVEAHVPNVMMFINQWIEKSKEARQSLSGHYDLSFGDTERQRMDIFPAEDSNRWLVFIHGGYWRLTSKDDYSFIAPPFVNQGINVAIFDYDLRPNVTIAEIIEQVRHELAWLVHNAANYSGSCEHLVVTGHSAGAHLTAMLYATNWDTYGIPHDTIKGGIGMSGLYELRPLIQTRMNEEFLNLTEETAREVSPIHYRPTVNAPLVLAIGEQESSEFRRQNYLLHGETGWQDITSDLVIAEGCHHFNLFDKFMDMTDPMWSKYNLFE